MQAVGCGDVYPLLAFSGERTGNHAARAVDRQFDRRKILRVVAHGGGVGQAIAVGVGVRTPQVDVVDPVAELCVTGSGARAVAGRD